MEGELGRDPTKSGGDRAAGDVSTQGAKRTRSAASVGPQRLGVEFVGVEVERGQGSVGDQAPEQPGNRGRREHAPVGAATHRNSRRRDRQLPELGPRFQPQAVRRARDRGDPPGDPRRVVLARVVLEAELSQDLVRPGRVAGDRECRRAVSPGADAGRRLDRLEAAHDVVVELLSRLRVDALVSVAVRCDLVPARDHLAQELGVAGSSDSEHEERGAHVELLEQREQGRRLALERRPAAVPVGLAEAPMDELVPVLEVDAEEEHERGH